MMYCSVHGRLKYTAFARNCHAHRVLVVSGIISKLEERDKGWRRETQPPTPWSIMQRLFRLLRFLHQHLHRKHLKVGLICRRTEYGLITSSFIIYPFLQIGNDIWLRAISGL